MLRSVEGSDRCCCAGALDSTVAALCALALQSATCAEAEVGGIAGEGGLQRNRLLHQRENGRLWWRSPENMTLDFQACRR